MGLGYHLTDQCPEIGKVQFQCRLIDPRSDIRYLHTIRKLLPKSLHHGVHLHIYSARLTFIDRAAAKVSHVFTAVIKENTGPHLSEGLRVILPFPFLKTEDQGRAVFMEIIIQNTVLNVGSLPCIQESADKSCLDPLPIHGRISHTGRPDGR